LSKKALDLIISAAHVLTCADAIVSQIDHSDSYSPACKLMVASEDCVVVAEDGDIQGPFAFS
jgi:hypothetical protein